MELKEYEKGTKWIWSSTKSGDSTSWEVVGYDGSSNNRYIWLKEVGSESLTENISYTITEFNDLVSSGKFQKVSTNNLKRSHLINFMKSMYTLGQMDQGAVGGPRKRTDEQFENLFNEFINGNYND